MKLEKLNLKNCILTKSQLSIITGGTSKTEYKQTGCAEMEQEIDPVTDKPIGEPKLVEFPD